ncbi:MAG: hypothetical protein HQK66_14090 [Desulfamplus sp.]|nr:hypothetical protein [Desulfamplus sp.]
MSSLVSNLNWKLQKIEEWYIFNIYSFSDNEIGNHTVGNHTVGNHTVGAAPCGCPWEWICSKIFLEENNHHGGITTTIEVMKVPGALKYGDFHIKTSWSESGRPGHENNVSISTVKYKNQANRYFGNNAEIYG